MTKPGPPTAHLVVVHLIISHNTSLKDDRKVVGGNTTRFFISTAPFANLNGSNYNDVINSLIISDYYSIMYNFNKFFHLFSWKHHHVLTISLFISLLTFSRKEDTNMRFETELFWWYTGIQLLVLLPHPFTKHQPI